MTVAGIAWVVACVVASLTMSGGSAFVVKAKAGAIVRRGIELDSDLVTTLAKGSRVTVEERAVSSKQAARCRVVAAGTGTTGWLSEKMLEAAPEAPKRKPVLAALHGTAANGDIFTIQLGPFLPKLRELFDVRFVDGPKEVDPNNPQAPMMKQFFGAKQVLREFANASLDDRGWRVYDGVDAAIERCEATVAAACDGAQPDALLCFSQGSNFGSMLTARAERRGEPYKAVVLLCGARPGWVKQFPPETFDPPLKTPALVGKAEKDAVVLDGPDEIAKLFEAPERCSHAEGHRPLPAKREASAELQATIAAFLSRKVVGAA